MGHLTCHHAGMSDDEKRDENERDQPRNIGKHVHLLGQDPRLCFICTGGVMPATRA
jgi:hypothetical protein